MIFLDKGKCKVTQFIKINLIEESNIVLQLEKQSMKIKGKNIRLSFFSPDELLFTGLIESIEFNDLS